MASERQSSEPLRKSLISEACANEIKASNQIVLNNIFLCTRVIAKGFSRVVNNKQRMIFILRNKTFFFVFAENFSMRFVRLWRFSNMELILSNYPQLQTIFSGQNKQAKIRKTQKKDELVKTS